MSLFSSYAAFNSRYCMSSVTFLIHQLLSTAPFQLLFTVGLGEVCGRLDSESEQLLGRLGCFGSALCWMPLAGGSSTVDLCLLLWGKETVRGPFCWPRASFTVLFGRRWQQQCWSCQVLTVKMWVFLWCPVLLDYHSQQDRFIGWESPCHYDGLNEKCPP